MHDHPREWRSRPPREVDQLVGYNLSLRRSAFHRFESALRSYWQFFELDACLQVKRAGFKVIFDFSNVVDHFPTNTAFATGRDGDLAIKVFNPAYNYAFVLARHTPLLRRGPTLAYLFLVGHSNRPGLLAAGIALKRYGHLRREVSILWKTWRCLVSGWRAGRRAAKIPFSKTLPESTR